MISNELSIKLNLIKDLVEEVTGECISGNGKTRGTQSVADARRLFLALVKKKHPCTLSTISNFLKIKAHASIIHLSKNLDYIIEHNEVLKDTFELLLKKSSSEDNIFLKIRILRLKEEQLIISILSKKKELEEIKNQLIEAESQRNSISGYSEIVLENTKN